MTTNQLVEETQKLSRRDLQAVFYIGRKLRLVNCDWCLCAYWCGQ